MGKGTAKGTRFANWLIAHILKAIWPTVRRSALQGIYDDADFVNCGTFMQPLMVEAKWRATTKGWRIAQWVNEIRTKQKRNGYEWVIFAAADMRTMAPIAIMDAERAGALLAMEASLQEEP
jgi:hypothetical protein